MWSQVYNPLGSELLSTLVAALPVVVLLPVLSDGFCIFAWDRPYPALTLGSEAGGGRRALTLDVTPRANFSRNRQSLSDVGAKSGVS